MAKYMTQQMSSSKATPKTYYRKQTQPHPSHEETGRFTRDAKQDYARFNHISVNQVVAGTFRSSQGIPSGRNTYEI